MPIEPTQNAVLRSAHDVYRSRLIDIFSGLRVFGAFFDILDDCLALHHE
jgi:hypothetical protein